MILSMIFSVIIIFILLVLHMILIINFESNLYENMAKLFAYTVSQCGLIVCAVILFHYIQEIGG